MTIQYHHVHSLSHCRRTSETRSEHTANHMETKPRGMHAKAAPSGLRDARQPAAIPCMHRRQALPESGPKIWLITPVVTSDATEKGFCAIGVLPPPLVRLWRTLNYRVIGIHSQRARPRKGRKEKKKNYNKNNDPPLTPRASVTAITTAHNSPSSASHPFVPERLSQSFNLRLSSVRRTGNRDSSTRL